MDDQISRQAAQPDTHDTNVGDTTQKNVIYSPVQMAMDYAVNATDFSASSDTISRLAAIDGADKIIERDTSGNNDVVKAMAAWKEWIKGLPSAQPVLDEWCTDCKEYDQERHCCPRWNQVIKNTLKDIQLDHKKGKWKEEPNCYYRCSRCSSHYPSILGYMDYKYCPNCGADMREST